MFLRESSQGIVLYHQSVLPATIAIVKPTNAGSVLWGGGGQSHWRQIIDVTAADMMDSLGLMQMAGSRINYFNRPGQGLHLMTYGSCGSAAARNSLPSHLSSPLQILSFPIDPLLLLQPRDWGQYVTGGHLRSTASHRSVSGHVHPVINTLLTSEY
ncbi:hypothetical protein J6590_009869 [Homalodisca vitripennis]|nr:hypothetical protein J6590_009869 [Homalodisca vitripennis]